MSQKTSDFDAQAALQICTAQKEYFLSGATRSYDFRKAQLKKLKDQLNRCEKDILDALKEDFSKPGFEAYASEVGFVHEEIDVAVSRLKSWMQPQKVKTPITSWPSKSYIITEPKGVCLIIGPWNYPFQLIFSPLVAAIAAGNTAVLKLPEETPAVSDVMQKMLEETFENRYIHVIRGKGSKLIPPLMKEFRFDHAFFTGSIPVGKKIAEMAAPHLTPVTLELGGKSPAVIDETADIHTAAKRIAFGKWINAGQTCVAPDYLLIKDVIKEKFLKELTDVLQRFSNGDALSSPDYTSIIHQEQYDRLKSYLQDGRVIHGGKYNDQELRMEPTILDDVSLESKIMQEEIFGPILPVFSFATKEEARKIISHNPYPLSFYIFTKSKKNEQYFIENLQFGNGAVNNAIVHLSNPDLPFGGVGTSGFGNYHGKAGFDTLSHKKSIMKTATWFDPSQKYPPYGKLAFKVIRKLMR